MAAVVVEEEVAAAAAAEPVLALEEEVAAAAAAEPVLALEREEERGLATRIGKPLARPPVRPGNLFALSVLLATTVASTPSPTRTRRKPTSVPTTTA